MRTVMQWSAGAVASVAVVVVWSPAAAQPTGPSWTAYVADFDSDTVTPIDVATNVAGTPIAVGDGPNAVASPRTGPPPTSPTRRRMM